jgi:hypothetical protein
MTFPQVVDGEDNLILRVAVNILNNICGKLIRGDPPT